MVRFLFQVICVGIGSAPSFAYVLARNISTSLFTQIFGQDLVLVSLNLLYLRGLTPIVAELVAKHRFGVAWSKPTPPYLQIRVNQDRVSVTVVLSVVATLFSQAVFIMLLDESCLRYGQGCCSFVQVLLRFHARAEETISTMAT